MSWWTDLSRSKASTWDYRVLDQDQACPDLPRRPVDVDTEYLHLFLRGMSLPYLRKWTTTYHCSLTSYLRLEHRGGDRAEFLLTTSPANLRGISKERASRVAMGPTRLAGPVPYRGGGIELEIGLFAIAAEDLAAPYLDFLQSIGDLTGVSFIGSALKMIQPLKAGLNGLLGVGRDALEIGLSRTDEPASTGVFAVLAASPDELRGKQFQLVGDALCWQDGRPVTDVAYIVFSVEASSKRADWSRLPGIAEVYQQLIEASRLDKLADAEGLLAQFERTVILSPDLVPSDAEELVTKTSKLIHRAMQTKPQSRAAVDLPEFANLGAFSGAALEEANRDLLKNGM
jgi:hypothetical protein